MHHAISKSGFRGALLLGSALAAAAFTVPAVAADQSKIETVVVTGSRIPTTNLTSASPISVVTADQIQMTSSFSLEDTLTNTTGPDFSGGLSVASNNGGVGLSLIGLRDLGPTRTLILVDGQRLIPVFVGSISAPDINTIPSAMVERVEVLRDGASSIYGADAIGGVINIITKKNFSGLQIETDGGLSEHGGGANYTLNATLGIDLDKGNVTISLLNQFRGAVGGWQRDWSTDTHGDDPNFPGGSSFRTQLIVMEDANSTRNLWIGGTPIHNDAGTGPGIANSIPCTTYISGLSRAKLDANCDTSLGGWNTLTSSLGRNQITLNGHYDITPDVTFVAEAFFTDRRSGQQLRPEPLLGAQIATTDDASGATIFPGMYVPADAHWGYTSGGVIVPCPAPNSTNPTTLAQNNCIIANDTPIQFGPRTYRQVAETFHMRTGLQGHVFGDYNWEIGFVHQRNDTVDRTFNSGNFQHLAQELGEAPCVDVPGGCTDGAPFGYTWPVPLTPVNWYDGPFNLSDAQKKYLLYTITDTNKAIEDYGYADVNGPLIDLPAGKVMGSVGLERRFEHLSDIPDALVQDGYAANKSNPTDGGYGVWSLYGELRIPVLKDMEFAKSLEIKPSARWDSYSNFGTATTYKVAADWQVNDDIRIRGGYNTGFRAPSVAELFLGNSVSYLTLHGDPCDSRTVGSGGSDAANTNMATTPGEASARLAAGTTCYNQLAALGLTAGQIAAYQSPENNLSADQRGFLLGGNPNLQPEKAHQWEIGMVLTPQFLPELSAGIDYYQGTITNTILDGGIPSALGGDKYVLGCFASAAAGGQNPLFCGIKRNLGAGISQINSQNQNFGVGYIEGLDMEATYTNDFDSMGIPVPGSITANIQVSRQFTNTQTNPDGSTTQFAGQFLLGNEAAIPKWKGTFNLNYVEGPFTLHWDTRWFGHVQDDIDGEPHVYGGQIPDYFWHNVSVAYDLPTWGPGANTKLIVGINNLFDKDPPFIGDDSICKCNSLAGAYDFIGRFFYTRITTKF